MRPHSGRMDMDAGRLEKTIRRALKDTGFKPRVAIETGTHFGTGSTQALIAALPPKVPIHTIESNSEFHAVARKNLAPHAGRVFAHHGSTVPQPLVLPWLCNDPWLGEPGLSSIDVVVDGLSVSSTPTSCYVSEVGAGLSGGNPTVFRDLLSKHEKDPVLVLLDSCGGLGLVEFLVFTSFRWGKPTMLVLDDVGHLKHFRSAAMARQWASSVHEDREAEHMVALFDTWKGKV